MAKIRIASMNVWNCLGNFPEWEERGLDCSAAVRVPGLARVVEEILPDVLGGQEVNRDMQTQFGYAFHDAGLPYTMIWGNFTPIFYRSDRLELIDASFICYPEHMEGYEANFNDWRSRTCTAAAFREKESGKCFAVGTTHLWYRREIIVPGSDEARRRQIGIAMDRLEAFSAACEGCPAFLVGDMNARRDAPAMRYATEERTWQHAYDIAAEYRCENMGYNGCGPKGPGTWAEGGAETAIDHILTKNLPCGALRCARHRHAQRRLRHLHFRGKQRHGRLP